MNTIMSDQLCARCHVQEAEPGNRLCHDCIAEDNATSWAPARRSLTDLDQLEDRPTEPSTGLVARLLWWLAFILIAGFVVLFTVDKANIPFINNLPGVAELRDNLNSFLSWWNDGIKKLGDSIGL